MGRLKVPAVSIVVATYNRSNVLRHAVESAGAQTFRDWEMWVVGDACSDDTEQVVASIDDERIRFVNLDVKNGDQAIPNNEGVKRASGDMIAYLNHDDLWFPDHLERCVDLLTRSTAGGVFSPAGIVALDGSGQMWPSPTNRFEAGRVHAPASGWVLRREVVDRVGPWRPRQECFDFPSLDRLLRAVEEGERIDQLPYLTVLTTPSGARPGSYASHNDDSELRSLWDRMQADPSFREKLLAEIALRASAELVRPQPIGHLRQTARDARFGLFGRRWTTVRNAIKYRHRGGAVDGLRRIRGLPPQ